MQLQIHVANYCTPASVFLVMAFMSLLYLFIVDVKLTGYCFLKAGTSTGRSCARSAMNTWGQTLLSVGFVLLWAWVLDWLCSHRMGSLSWFLVFLPHIVFLLTSDVSVIV